MGLLPSGKHKGRAFNEVCVDDPPYTIWCAVSVVDELSPLWDFAEYAREHLLLKGDQCRLWFGQHGALTYAELVTQQPEYAAELAASVGEHTYPSQRWFASWYNTRREYLAAHP